MHLISSSVISNLKHSSPHQYGFYTLTFPQIQTILVPMCSFCFKSNHAADQRICFRYKVQSLFFLNTKFQAVAVQPSLCLTRLKTPKTGFIMIQLIRCSLKFVTDEPKASTSTADDGEATTNSVIEERSGAGDGVQSSYNPDHVTGSMLQVLAQVRNVIKF